MSVNNKQLLGSDALTVSTMVKGPTGTKVVLEVYRPNVGELKIIAYRTGAISQVTKEVPLLDPKVIPTTSN